jgi:hypothetical protein
MERLGYLSAIDAIRLLEAGLPVYIVSAPADTHALPLDGAWVDDDGRIHYDCSCVCINTETAHAIGRKYNQQCILRLYPSCFTKSGVFLLKDTPFTRTIALDYAGGYTADGEWLFTAVENINTLPLEEEYEEFIPAEVEFIPVK